jgi:hypothetical protein
MKHFTIALMAAAALVCTQAAAQKQVKNVYASSNKLNIEQLQNAEQPVQLNRYLFAGYNTLCLPMTLSSEQLAGAAADVRIERLAAIQQEGTALNLYFVECTDEGVQAGVPYLIYSPKAQYLRVKTAEALTFDPAIKAVRMSDDNGNQITFGSSWESIQKDGRYGIPAQQSVTPLESILERTDGEKTFLPTRCGFTWDTQAPTATELKIQHAPSLADITAIKRIDAVDKAAGQVFDLSGRKVKNQNKKGIYVVDGEKVIVQ